MAQQHLELPGSQSSFQGVGGNLEGTHSSPQVSLEGDMLHSAGLRLFGLSANLFSFVSGHFLLRNCPLSSPYALRYIAITFIMFFVAFSIHGLSCSSLPTFSG